MADASPDHPQAIAAALGVLDRHIAALNAGDAAALARTLHFPHYRLAGGRMRIWESAANYLEDFHARAGDAWHHSAWEFRNPIGCSPDKVHLDVGFCRYRADGFGSLADLFALEGCPLYNPSFPALFSRNRLPSRM